MTCTHRTSVQRTDRRKRRRRREIVRYSTLAFLTSPPVATVRCQRTLDLYPSHSRSLSREQEHVRAPNRACHSHHRTARLGEAGSRRADYVRSPAVEYSPTDCVTRVGVTPRPVAIKRYPADGTRSQKRGGSTSITSERHSLGLSRSYRSRYHARPTSGGRNSPRLGEIACQ